MIKTIKQARAALSLLNPGEVRERAEREVHVGLVASSPNLYEELEQFLGAEVPGRVHRADDPNPPATVDLVIYQHGAPRDRDTYTFDRYDPDAVRRQMLDDHDDLALPLARQFAIFRKPVVDRIVKSIARENALFAIATALPNVAPTFFELPWAFGEFASDTAFLTGNQIRMAFLIAAACGGEVGFGHQKSAVLSIIGGAFGWRAIARELAGKIPLGGGLIPKGAIAYAGTIAVGKGLEFSYRTNRRPTRSERSEIYGAALAQGAQAAAALR
jgi:hypothetical protein